MESTKKERRESTLMAGVRVEAGRLEDWYALAGLHYRSHLIGGVAKIFVLKYSDAAGVQSINPSPDPLGHPLPRERGEEETATRGELIGVIAYSYPAVALAARNRALAPLVARLPARGRARFWNGHLRTISRVVLEPNWRGLGLAARLVRETLPQAGTPYVEALAAMARVHPFFAQAGMTEYDAPPPPQSERLREALAAAGLGRADARSAAALVAAVTGLGEEEREWLVGEIGRWTRSYLGAKTAKTWRPTLEQSCGYVARFLYSEPSYYLWAAAALQPRAEKVEGRE
jgi:GNAT superfamily N-acetyltransferase